MITIEQLSPKAHRMVIMAEYCQDDAQKIVDFAHARNAAGGGGNLLVDLTAMAGLTFGSVVIELAHIPALMQWAFGLDRIAIISDEGWIRSASRLESALLPGIEYQVYDEDEAEAALAWVLEQSEGPHTGAVREIAIGRPGIVAYELSGRLDREESERAVAMVCQRLEDPAIKRLMLVIRHWHGFDLDRLLSQKVLSGKLEIIRKLDRYAIVGGPKWLRTYGDFASGVMRLDVKSFEPGEEEAALAWLGEGLAQATH